MNGTLPFSEACERNKEPILEVLQEHLPRRGFILEIGSGTGQHAVFFANALSTFKWQPSELPENLSSLAARIEQEGGENLKPPISLDVLEDDISAWPERILTAAFSANTAHIMNWEMVSAMFAGMGQRLKQRGLFFLYGPFNKNGKYTSDSNQAFDLSLKSRNPEMGLRDVKTLSTLAEKNDMKLVKQVDLPANNMCLVFSKNDIQR